MRAAVHLDDDRVAAAAARVDGARDQLLAGAGLAEHEHRGVGRGDHLDVAEHALHHLGAADDLAEVALGLQLLLQVDVPPFELLGVTFDDWRSRSCSVTSRWMPK